MRRVYFIGCRSGSRSKDASGGSRRSDKSARGCQGALRIRPCADGQMDLRGRIAAPGVPAAVNNPLNAALPLPLSPLVAHFAISIVQQSVRTRWEQLIPAVKEEIKSAALGLMENASIISSRFLCSKISQLMSDVAKLEWPHAWPVLIERLCAHLSGASAELSLGVLRTLAEDCTNADFNTSLPTPRRTAILQGLHRSLPTLLGAMYAALERCWNEISTRGPGRKQLQLLP